MRLSGRIVNGEVRHKLSTSDSDDDSRMYVLCVVWYGATTIKPYAFCNGESRWSSRDSQGRAKAFFPVILLSFINNRVENVHKKKVNGEGATSERTSERRQLIDKLPCQFFVFCFYIFLFYFIFLFVSACNVTHMTIVIVQKRYVLLYLLVGKK